MIAITINGRALYIVDAQAALNMQMRPDPAYAPFVYTSASREVIIFTRLLSGWIAMTPYSGMASSGIYENATLALYENDPRTALQAERGATAHNSFNQPRAHNTNQPCDPLD